MKNQTCLSWVPVALLALTATCPAYAYIGPGAGLGAIGTAIAFVGAILFAIVGFIWYPIKRMLKKKKNRTVLAPSVADANDSPPEQSKSQTR